MAMAYMGSAHRLLWPVSLMSRVLHQSTEAILSSLSPPYLHTHTHICSLSVKFRPRFGHESVNNTEVPMLKADKEAFLSLPAPFPSHAVLGSEIYLMEMGSWSEEVLSEAKPYLGLSTEGWSLLEAPLGAQQYSRACSSVASAPSGERRSSKAIQVPKEGRCFRERKSPPPPTAG
ncbi:hypothetical protein EYF80_023303 [Liparis tanakae]|uniref:Uncharacterized protein n=1 Tax=Liparis tanakae TaxID=230148 RepID=A0A4Z2HLS1_9TELE|nr:hypothetical protein EYF80_023303 [Liparis tanakae]